MSKIKTKFITDNAVTNAKLAQIPTQTIKGRTTASTGDVEDLTATQATAILNNFIGDSGSGGTKGLVLAPSAGDAASNKFLKADGSWQVGVKTDLSNLTTTSVNASLTPNATHSYSLGSTTTAWAVVRGGRFSPNNTTITLPNASWTAGGNVITFTGGTDPIALGVDITWQTLQGFTGLDLGRSFGMLSLTTSSITVDTTFFSSGSGTLGSQSTMFVRTEAGSGTASSGAIFTRSGPVINGISGEAYFSSGRVNGGGTGASGRALFYSGQTNSGRSGDVLLQSGTAGSGDTGNVYIGSGGSTSGTTGSVTISAGTTSGVRGSISLFATSISVGGSNIINLADPTSAQDAATKNYVDTVAGGTTRSINSISSNTTLSGATNTDYYYFVTNTTTATLPTAVSNTNQYVIKNTGSGVVTIATTSSQTIDGNLTALLSVPNSSLTVISDGSNWQIV